MAQQEVKGTVIWLQAEDDVLNIGVNTLDKTVSLNNDHGGFAAVFALLSASAGNKKEVTFSIDMDTSPWPTLYWVHYDFQ
jgi:hypothetical protein